MPMSVTSLETPKGRKMRSPEPKLHEVYKQLITQGFLRKMLGTRIWGPDFSDSKDLMIIFADSRDPKTPF